MKMGPYGTVGEEEAGCQRWPWEWEVGLAGREDESSAFAQFRK